MQLNRKHLAGSFVVRVTVVKIGDVGMGVHMWLMAVLMCVTPLHTVFMLVVVVVVVVAVFVFVLGCVMTMMMFVG
jgi:hypothetical protein